ncbi:hypothetical protein RJ641_007529 [Dillenia turbinata]|uniref:LTI65/LTI78 PGEED repeat domain-containing protein n=1 Tax=Dillenia turbinata TaxID=194707 RepID=A0AAN8V1D7_9MAGN
MWGLREAIMGNVIEPIRRVAPDHEGNSISRQIRDSLRKQAFPLDDDGPKDENQISDPGNYQTKVDDPTGANFKHVVPPYGNGNAYFSSSGELDLSGVCVMAFKVFVGLPITGRVTPTPTAEVAKACYSFAELTRKNEHVRGSQIRSKTTTLHSDQFAPEPPTEKSENISTDKQQTALENQPPSCTQEVSSATSAITDKALNAKSIVTSILGYGAQIDSNTTEPHNESGNEAESGKVSSVTDYSRKVASTAMEKLTPLYGKVAGEGSAAVSKVYGKENELKNQDRGVSVKEYLAKKLRPGGEDKALSDAISDGVHERKEEPEQKMGRVTESEESGVVGRHKGAVTSLFGRGGDHTEALQGSGNENLYGPAGDETDQDEGNVAGRSLRESSKLVEENKIWG